MAAVLVLCSLQFALLTVSDTAAAVVCGRATQVVRAALGTPVGGRKREERREEFLTGMNHRQPQYAAVLETGHGWISGGELARQRRR